MGMGTGMGTQFRTQIRVPVCVRLRVLQFCKSTKMYFQILNLLAFNLVQNMINPNTSEEAITKV